MKNKDEILDSLILGGIIGSALGALLSDNKKNGSVLGALAGSVLLATLKANEEAFKTNIPVFIEENGVVYEINSRGEKNFIKKIEKSQTHIPKRFTLK